MQLSPELAALAAAGARLALIVAVALAAFQLARRAIPRFVALAVRPDSDDPAPLEEGELAKRRATLAAISIRSVQVVLTLLAALTLLSELGIDIAPILAGAGVLGIAVGFGAQTLVRDVIGGLFILVEDQYRKGDVVKIADVAGMVESVGLRRTVLRDLDGIVHSVPNGLVGVASNFTHGWSRVNLDVQVSYREDLDRVIPVIDALGKDMAADPAWSARILEAPRVLRVDDLGESGVTLKILATTAPLEQWNVAGELRRRLKRRFDREGIEIPYPHRVVISRPETPFTISPEPALRASAGPDASPAARVRE